MDALVEVCAFGMALRVSPSIVTTKKSHYTRVHQPDRLREPDRLPVSLETLPESSATSVGISWEGVEFFTDPNRRTDTKGHYAACLSIAPSN